MTAQKDLFVTMALTAWLQHNKQLDKLLAQLTDEQLQKETAPGRNTGVYLLGHLTAVSDLMLPLLGLGERLYPELDEPFINNGDKKGFTFPPVTDLRKYWAEVSANVNEKFAGMHTDEWFAKHNSVSAEAFATEPHRNKLNVLLSRTNHLAWHLGQMAYLG